MQITSRFTIAVHIITCIHCFQDDCKVTSNFIAGSTGVNPVIIRGVLSQLKAAGMIHVRQGASGITLAKPLEKITFFDVYEAVDSVKDEGLFHFHENPNPDCPVGKNIHFALDRRLAQVQAAMENELKQIRLSDVAADVQAKIEAEKK